MIWKNELPILDSLEHKAMMYRALALARRASGATAPNPIVGALVVKDGRILGQGWHRFAGSAHAEVNALAEAGEAARGADLYVSLEPCNHHGRTPPCTEAILKHGIKRVFYAASDPNPSVAGGGGERLKSVGIEVYGGLLAEEAARMYRAWYHWLETGRPYLVAILGFSLDSKVQALPELLSSRSILSQVSRSKIFRLLKSADACLTEDSLVDTSLGIPGFGSLKKHVFSSQATTGSETSAQALASSGRDGQHLLICCSSPESIVSMMKQAQIQELIIYRSANYAPVCLQPLSVNGSGLSCSELLFSGRVGGDIFTYYKV